MRIRWHGHSCFEIADNITVVIDPHDGRSLGIRPPSASADIVLMTHDHSDHNAFKVIRGAHKDVFSFTGEFMFEGSKFTGLLTDHDEFGGAKRGRNTIYTMKVDGISICHCGDLGSIPDKDVMDKIKGTDILMVPVGEVYTMNVTDVIRFIDMAEPRVIVPMHYRVGGLSLPINSVDNFIDRTDWDVEHVGNEIDLSYDELPSERTIWVFSR